MRSVVEISQSQLITNYQAFKRLNQHRQLLAVVKGNAYGHGLREVVQVLNTVADGFCVEDGMELRVLRRESRKFCLVLGHVGVDEVLVEDVSHTHFSLFTWDQLPEFAALAKKCGYAIPVHIKVDAKLGRLGFLSEEIKALAKVLSSAKYIEAVGVYSHLSTVKSGELAHANTQFEVFNAVAELLSSLLEKPLSRHLDATGGLVYFKNSNLYDVARVGAGIYGIWPSKQEMKREVGISEVELAMRWCSQVMQVKTLPVNWPVGYDQTFITERITKIAVIPQGYADGYDRQLSNAGCVLIQGKRCKILGRISMNVMVADVTEVAEVKVGDEVVLLGKQGNAQIHPQEIAEVGKTNAYEIVTRVSPLLERVIV